MSTKMILVSKLLIILARFIYDTFLKEKLIMISKLKKLSLTVLVVGCSSQSKDLSSLNHITYSPKTNNVALLVGAPCALPEKKDGDGGFSSASFSAKDVKKKKSCSATDEMSISQNFNMMTSVANIFKFNKISYLTASLGSGIEVRHLLRTTQALAEEVGKDGTFMWYFSGHSSPTKFGLLSERFRIGQILNAIKRGAGTRIKRLIIVLDTCYAARVIDGNDPIDTDDSEDVPEDFNTSLRSLVEKEFGENKVELIVSVASQKTSYSYFDKGGSAYTTAIKNITTDVMRRGDASILSWLQGITKETIRLTTNHGLFQHPAFLISSKNVANQMLLSGGAENPGDDDGDNPPPSREIDFKFLKNIGVNSGLNGYFLYPENNGRGILAVKLAMSKSNCRLTRYPKAVTVFKNRDDYKSYDLIESDNGDIVYYNANVMPGEYISLKNISSQSNCEIPVYIGY